MCGERRTHARHGVRVFNSTRSYSCAIAECNSMRYSIECYHEMCLRSLRVVGGFLFDRKCMTSGKIYSCMQRKGAK